MSDPNIKFFFFRQAPDIQAITERMRSQLGCFEVEVINRYWKPGKDKVVDSEIKLHKDLREIVSAADDHLRKHFLDSACAGAMMWHRTGPIKPGELLSRSFIGWNHEDDRSNNSWEAFKSVQEKLPISIEPTYNAKSPDIIKGDIVAMNRSTLREIIAHD